MSLLKFVNFPALGDDRGSLVALEANQTVPFDIQRVYYILVLKLVWLAASMLTKILNKW